MSNDIWGTTPQLSGEDLFDSSEASFVPSELTHSEKKPSGLSSPTATYEQMKEIKKQTIDRLMKIDPLVREEVLAANAMAAVNAYTSPQRTSPIKHDDQGNFTGITDSVVSGPSATVTNQTALMKAIGDSIMKRMGIEQ